MGSSAARLARSPWFWIGLLQLVLGLVAQFLPLARDLHYEFAALCAVGVSLLSGVATLASVTPALHTAVDEHLVRSLGLRPIVLAVLLSLLPLPVSIIRNLALSPCGIAEGIAWYLILVPAAAMISVVLAMVAARMTHRRWLRLVVFVSLWSASLVRGAYEAATGPHIYLYAWQVGYFPGGSWDPDLPITPLLLGYRAAHLVVAVLVLLVVRELSGTPSAERRRAGRGVIAGGLVAAACVVLLIPDRSELGLTRTDSWLRETLGDSVRTRFATIYYHAPTTDSLELWQAVNYTDFHAAEEARILGLAETDVAPITFYCYANAAEQKRLVGTSSASFTKPWRRTLNLTFDRVTVTLRHELAHIVLQPYGNILGITWSNGLLEGTAVALEHWHDPAWLHRQARAMDDFGLMPPVTDVMGAVGFAGHRATLSYVLTGSFVRWLVDTYGMPRLLRAYRAGSLAAGYGDEAPHLAARYRSFLQRIPATRPEFESTVKYLYGGGSYFLQKCLRRIGRMNALGFDALAERRYDRALERFGDALEEGINYTSRAGILRTLHDAGRWQQFLDSAAAYDRDTASYPLLPYLVERSDALRERARITERDSLLRVVIAATPDDWSRVRAVARLRLDTGALSPLMGRYFANAPSLAERLILLHEARKAAGGDSIAAFLLALLEANQLVGGSPSLALTLVGTTPSALDDTSAWIAPYVRRAVSTLARPLLDAWLMSRGARGSDTATGRALMALVRMGSDPVARRASGDALLFGRSDEVEAFVSRLAARYRSARKE